MNKKILLIFLSIFIILTFSSCVMAENTASVENNISSENNNINIEKNVGSQGNSIIEVDGSSRNQMNEPTIQTAIDTAKAGDTILITGTEYEHCHFIVNKPLNIVSNVGTTMTTCPSNIKGSDGIGIFYFNEQASGSTLSGFTLSNDWGKRGSVDPYAIYINGASNIEITNCRIKEVSDGPGIYINNGLNININEVTVQRSIKGIYLVNTSYVNITKSVIERNTESGIYIGKNVKSTNIVNNTIYRNNWKGIYFESCVDSNITSNNISDNRDNAVQSRAMAGVGIFINSTMKSLKIKGNNIFQNGEYGIYHTYLAVPSIDEIKKYSDIEKIEEIDENFFTYHLTRGIYVQQTAEGGTYTVYVGSNFYANEQFCPSTFYEPGVLRNGERDLVFSDIQEASKGVYKISFIKRHTGEIAKTLNTVDVTFFLNKNSTKASIEPNDQAKVIRVVNGTAKVDFTDGEYKPSGNTITAISTGYGAIDPSIVFNRLSARYNVPDSRIPNGTSNETKLIGTDTTAYYHTSEYIVLLQDSDENPLAGQNITFRLNGKDYPRATNENGTAKIKINLDSGIYEISAIFEGNDDYEGSSTTNTVTILSTISAENLVKVYRNASQYYATFVDGQGNPLTKTDVTFNINGVMYTRKTNENGTAKLNINLNPGTFIITATNPINNEMHSNNITVLPTITDNKNLVKYYKNASQYIVTLVGDDGNPVGVGETVTFNINGVLYKRTTNATGQAKLNINLDPGDYVITAEYKGCRVSNIVTVKPVLSAKDLVKEYGTSDQFKAKLVDGQGNPLAGEKVTFNINGVLYTRSTKSDGIAYLNIRLEPGTYIITSTHNEVSIGNTVEVLKTLTVSPNLSNREVQSLLDSTSEKVAVKFLGDEYSDISLNLKKTFLINGNNAKFNGKANSAVFTVNSDNIIIKNANINANNGSGIVVNNVKNTVIENNVITNTLDKSKMEKYNSGEELLPGNGISVSGAHTEIINNTISYFEHGIYLKNANENTIKENQINKNNFGIEFDTGVSNTQILNNNISNQIGLITLTMVEGPYGYGISVRHSGINIEITDNLINENYMGIFLDSANSRGIAITGNEIRDSIIEGFTANENYTPATGATLIVENNAIYNNAKGPSLMILGEVSANPAGIYGPGEWDDDKKLVLGPNWYGTTLYTKWGENNTGPGTICPRIKTTLIDCKIYSLGNGKYEVNFLNGNKTANELPDFTYYFTLNAYTPLQKETIAYAHEGKATIEFPKENFNSTGNIIEGSSGSLFDSERPFRITYTYNVPDSEIPK